MEYKVFPFLITNYEEMSVIQNSKNIVIIKDEAMINFFNWVDTNAVYDVSDENFNEVFKEKTDRAVDFMKNNCLIEKVNPKKVEYENITVVSNDEIFINSMKFNSIGHAEKFIFELLPRDFCEFKVNNQKNLYIFFLNPFNYKYYTELVDSVKSNNILSRFSFYYNNNVFLSNYYKREWYNPCPLCFFGNIESSLRGMSNIYNTVSFQTLLDLIYKKDPKFEIQNKFSNYSILTFVNTLLNDLNITENAKINNVQYIDFNRNITLTDQAMHWEACDCYE